MKRTIVSLVALVVVAVWALAACGGGSGNPLSGPSAGPAPAGTVVVGSANFTESQLLGSIYAQALAARGVKVTEKPDLGSREAYIHALQDGSIDLIPEYSGVLLQYFQPKAPQRGSREVYAALRQALPQGLRVLDMSTAQDRDAIVVTAATARRYHLSSIADLAPHCGELTFGGPPELAQRPDGLPGFRQNYGCVFKEFKQLDAGGPLTVKALQDGTVQAADIFTTNASIPQDDFVVLADPKNNFAAQNVLPLIRTSSASPVVTQVLDAVSAKLTTQRLTDLNRRLAAPDKPAIAVVAKQWLTAAGLA